MLKATERNKYDYLLILIISLGFCGELFSPITIQRIIAVISFPWMLLNIRYYYRRIPNVLTIFFFLWILITVCSISWSINKINGCKFIIYNICSITNFYTIIILYFKSKKPLQSIVFGWVLLFIFTVPIALWEIYTNNHLYMSIQTSESSSIDSEGLKVARVFASVTYGNLNNYVVTVIYCLPFILSWIGFSRNRIMGCFIMVSLVFILLMNSSRGGLLCLGLSSVTAFYYYSKYSLIKKKYLVFVTLIFIGLIGFNAQYLLNQIAGRLIESSLMEDSSRSEIYLRGLKILKNTYCFGCGTGSIEENLEILAAGKVAAMHNMYLEFLVEYGLVTFIFFIILLGKIFVNLITSKIIQIKMIGWNVLIIAIPLFIINSRYLESSLFWIFWASLFSLSLMTKPFGHKSTQFKKNGLAG